MDEKGLKSTRIDFKGVSRGFGVSVCPCSRVNIKIEPEGFQMDCERFE